MAVDKRYASQGLGSYLLEWSYGLVEWLLQTGIACRFLTVDADIETREKTPDFYARNGFIVNQKYQKVINPKMPPESVSMRDDIFTHEDEADAEGA